MTKTAQPCIIYNLFPRLAGTIDQWMVHIEQAKKMGFDWIFVNPFHYPGFSGSLYAVKDYYKLNPLFVNPGITQPPITGYSPPPASSAVMENMKGPFFAEYISPVTSAPGLIWISREIT